MKKIILTTLISGFVILPILILAAVTPGKIPGAAELGIDNVIPNPSPTGLMAVIVSIVKWVYTAFFVIAVLIILFAAYTYLTAGGDPAKISTVHKQLIYIAVAIAIALIAVGVEKIIENLLTGNQVY